MQESLKLKDTRTIAHFAWNLFNKELSCLSPTVPRVWNHIDLTLRNVITDTLTLYHAARYRIYFCDGRLLQRAKLNIGNADALHLRACQN